MTGTNDSFMTPHDLRTFDWQAIIASANKKTCHIYEKLFAAKAKELEASGQDKEQQICLIMGIFCSFSLSLDTPNEPYKPAWVWHDGRRSYIPSDIKESILDALLAIVTEIEDAEMRARVADVLWVLRRANYQIAGVAINAYLESATTLEDPNHWVEGASRIERALQLATQLGRNGEHFTKTFSYIEALLNRLNGEDPLWLSHKLMSLLLDARVGDPSKYAALAEKIASHAETTRYWRRARDYWEIQARWHERDDRLEESAVARLRAAETYVSEAGDLMNSQPPNYIAATRELADAVEALRRANAPRERINQVHALLLECQEKAAAQQMEYHSHSVNITDFVNEAREAVKGKTLRDAILFLASSCRPTSADQVRKQVLSSQKESPLYWWIFVQQVNERGRVVAHRPGLSPEGSNDTNEKAIRAEMFRNALNYQGLQAEATILPILNQINIEHHIRLSDLMEFVVNNPFVPSGHEVIYARGLYYGLIGDFLLAAHLLLPQVENSIRYLLNQNGVITTKLDSQGVQDEVDLGTLLYMPELEPILGSDLLFDLQGLLVSRFGSNLRNYAAHGMLNANAFGSRQVVYFWWLMLYLCCYPALVQATKSQSENSERQV